MARIRSIHPGFFTDEAIVSASPQAQIFLIGVWTQCDDQGVFEWKPVTLKMRILPAASCDVTVLLAELVSLGIVKQIDVGSLKYGLVRNFRKYQRPKKPNSTFPLPVEFRTYVGLTGDIPEPSNDKDGPSSPPVPHQSPTSSEISPQMEEGGGRMEDEGGGEEEHEVEPAAPVGASAPELDLTPPPFLASDTRAALDAYNETATRVGWPKAQTMGRDRWPALKARLKECGGLEGWRIAMAKAEASSFLNGTARPGEGHENWRPSIDFFLKPKRFRKLMEGGYDDADGDRKQQKSGASTVLSALAEFGREGTG